MSVNMGDIFQLGDHRLIYGDCRDTELVKKLVEDKKINLVVTDPPYGVAVVESKAGLVKLRKNKIIANDQEQSEEEYRQFTADWLRPMLPYLSPKNSLYIFNSDKQIFALREGMKDCGVRFTQLLIWLKTSAVMGRLHYLPQHELIAYGWYGSHQFFKSQDKSVLICPKPHQSLLHPTMKPVSLLRNLILNSSKIGDFVYDPFGGSGSTIIAAEQTKRKCLMVEIDGEYCQTIINRFEKLTGLKAKKI